MMASVSFVADDDVDVGVGVVRGYDETLVVVFSDEVAASKRNNNENPILCAYRSSTKNLLQFVWISSALDVVINSPPND